MTIENIETIDGIGISKDGGEVVLQISDHLEWVNNEFHLNLIEKKIGLYLGFIKSGQLLEIIPEAGGRSIRIDIICKFEPSELASIFLNAAMRQLKVMDIKLSYGMLPD